ncbi:single-stranded-DNA-specific exonuclease RecJ [Halomicronema sp. CCY15110]|uniref:single-stranded-DNA-specific exonuclease RecJ n=1 Tax=Halomicronema sp. CCY15110 TaxID=2767773 RepID=UPI00281611C1|nr:single-stranded-DNA-specific exonuclease RecJ [Halomicronema sp. CCY15110]
MSDPAKANAKPIPQPSVSQDSPSAEAYSGIPDQRWQIHPALKGEAQGLAQQLQRSPLVTQVLLNRAIETPEAAQEFLNPESLLLPSPLDEFPDLEPSIEILLQAIELGEKIAICGDYDADGMTSTALLLRALRYLGAQVDYAIPSRMQEGYGINTRIVDEFFADGISIILTVDNGIAAVEPIAHARELGLTVIVTDHHDVPPEIPPAHAILNPKLIPPESPYYGVAGVGVAYILAVCLAQAMGRIQDLTAPLLELFTLGTIADLAPLTGVNRRWVRRGLRLLPKSRLIGVQALIKVAGLGDENDTLKPEDIGFRLGPRINAVGRIGDPQVVIEMLTTDDVDVALQRALECEAANQQRREMCDRIEEEAIAWVEAQITEGSVDLVRDRVLLVLQPDWHHGVIGIVASRLVERYGVPVFICTYEDDDHKEIRGSARGIPEFQVFEALQSCHDLMIKFGGHKAAGGFSFLAKHLRQVKSRLVNFANQTLRIEHLKPLVTVDVRATFDQLTFALHDQLDQLHPCGIGNPDPVFWTPNVRVAEQRAIGQTKAHLKLTVADDADHRLTAIAWRWGTYCPLPDRLDIAYKLKINEWQGNTSLQLELVGVRPPTLPTAAARTVPVSHTAPVNGQASPQLPLTVAEAPPVRTSGQSDPVAASPQRPGTPAPSAAATHGRDTAPAPVTQATSQAEFYYSHRCYQVRTVQTGHSRQLEIQNPESQVFVVSLPDRQGYLCVPGATAKPVDLSEPHYFNLLRAGLDALEIRQQTHLLLEKDELLADKDQHIATLTRQIELLQARAGQSSVTQTQQLQALQAEVKAQETAMQHQEAHIETIKQTMHRPPPTLDPKAIKREVRDAVSDKVWFCLQTQSQKDLYAAYKHVALAAADGSEPQTADYREAGLRLGHVVEREVVRPCLDDLHGFLQRQGHATLANLPLGTRHKYTVAMVVPLWADAWTTVKPAALKASQRPSDQQLYAPANSEPVSPGDRALLVAFLAQWEHPMSAWFQAHGDTAATYLDQISQLQQVAAQASPPLYQWAFEHMRELVIGDAQTPGLLQRIYA